MMNPAVDRTKPTVILLLLLLTVWSTVIFLFDFNGLYGQDAHAYYQYTAQIINYLHTGEVPGAFYWPIGYPVLAGIFMFFVKSGLSMQLCNLLALLGICHYSSRLISLLHHVSSKVSLTFTLLVVGLSPFLLRHSLVSMADLSALFFTLAALYYGLKSMTDLSVKTLMGAVILTSLAVQVRYSSAIILILPFLYLFVDLIRKKKFILILSCSLVFAILTLPQFIWLSSHSISHMTSLYGSSWDISNLFKSSFNTHEGSFNYAIPNVLFVLEFIWHPAYFFGTIILLPFIRKSDFSGNLKRIVLFSMLFSCVIIAGIPTQNHRFLLPTFVLCSISLYPAFDRLSMRLKELQKWFVAALIIFLQLVFFYFAFQNIYHLNKLERQIAVALSSEASETVYSFGMDVALHSYLTDKEIISLWEETYPSFKSGAVVLFNEEKFSKQWQGKSVMINWENVNRFYTLKLINTFDEGWKLYEIQ